jgi:caffeoyl-CoA O-methyltransferase
MSFDSKGYGQGDPRLARWAEQLFAPRDMQLREILERSKAAGLPGIAVAPFDGLHLEVLTRAIAPMKAVEIGSLGGYSGVCILRGLPTGGVLHTFELSITHAQVAVESYARNGFTDNVKLYPGPALENLKSIEALGPFDLVFIDADKAGYPDYLAWAERNLRIGGVVLGDNAFGWGGVLESKSGDGSVESLKRFDERLAQGGVFRSTMLPTAEGLAMGVKVREPSS